MVSECMAPSIMFANILQAMHQRQAVRMKTSVINSTSQPQHLVLRASCRGYKWPQCHPLPSLHTVLSVFNVAIFNYYHREVGKIEVLRKAAPCTSFLWCYIWYRIRNDISHINLSAFQVSQMSYKLCGNCALLLYKRVICDIDLVYIYTPQCSCLYMCNFKLKEMYKNTRIWQRNAIKVLYS